MLLLLFSVSFLQKLSRLIQQTWNIHGGFQRKIYCTLKSRGPKCMFCRLKGYRDSNALVSPGDTLCLIHRCVSVKKNRRSTGFSNGWSTGTWIFPTSSMKSSPDSSRSEGSGIPWKRSMHTALARSLSMVRPSSLANSQIWTDFRGVGQWRMMRSVNSLMRDSTLNSTLNRSSSKRSSKAAKSLTNFARVGLMR